MKQLFISILMGMFLFVGQTALAQTSCSEVFKESNSRDFLFEENLLTQFEINKQGLVKSTTLTEANDIRLNLVELSNQILDQAIDYIIQVNYMRLPAEAKAQKDHVAEQLIEELQQTFQIDNNTMTAAIKNRINIEVVEIQAKGEAQQTRRAIGFGRDQSSEKFHSEAGEKLSIGFRSGRVDETSEIEVIGKQPLGFALKGDRGLERSIKERVEYEEKQSVEFVPLRSANKELLVKKNPIGFALFKPSSETITEAQLHKIMFNIDIGSFEFQKGEH